MSKETLIIDGKGTEKLIRPVEQVIFQDKKTPVVDEESILKHLQQARELYKSMEVGQKEATVELKPKYPDLPAFIWLLNDSHMGSVFTDYERLIADYKVVKETPNFYTITNGDEIDNFLVDTAQAAGVYEDSISPEQQALLVQRLFRELAGQEKLLLCSFGNHNDFIQKSGFSFEGTWLRDLPCPVFNCGGLLNLKFGSQEYKIATTHRFWGFSRLNPTNACKRFMEHAYPDADIVYLGHSHQKEYLSFQRGGKERLAIIGGCYKTDDTFGPKRGLGGGGQMGGLVLELRPDKRDMHVFDSVQEASEYFELLREIRGKNDKK